MKNWQKRPNFIKGMCLLLAGVLAVPSVNYFYGDKMEVSAAGVTLPGIEQIREEYMGSTKTYKILEIVPDIGCAEFGYYIGGQEPFTQLYDAESGSFRKWEDVLLTKATVEERKAFMAGLSAEAELVNAYYKDTGVLPFMVETYKEYLPGEEVPEDAQKIFMEAIAKRGYLEAGEGQWDAVFSVLSDWELTLDEINYSVTTPYYKAIVEENSFSYQELKEFAEANPEADMYMMRPEGYLEFMGDASEVWEQAALYVEEAIASAAASVPLSNKNTVSEGDIPAAEAAESAAGEAGAVSVEEEVWNAASDVYAPTFSLIGEANPILLGEHVYLMSKAEYKGEGLGDYVLVETVEMEKPGESFYLEETYLYYTGGIRSNEVFKSRVFGLEEQEQDRFQISVEVVTPQMLNGYFSKNSVTSIAGGVKLLSNYDFIYVNGGAAMNTVRGTDYYYCGENDIAELVMASLGMCVVKKQMPCVVDLQPWIEVISDAHNIYVDSKDMAEGFVVPTNMIRLAYFLMNPVTSADGEDLHNDMYWKALGDIVRYVSDTSDFDFTWKSNTEFFGTDSLVNRQDENCAKRDASFVKGSVWFICNEPVENSELTLQNKGLFSNMEYALEQIKAGFFPVWEEIRVENLYLAEQGEERLETKIYDESVFRYIINYSDQRQMDKESLDVLVIEPAGRVASPEVNTAKFASLTGVEAGKITLHVMAMNEFVGHIEDLNAAYDVIYFDANTTGLVTANGKTVYNDEKMNGLLYSHVGDTIEVFASVSGLLDTDYTNNNRESSTLKETTMHRYSGNDLSLEKYNALLDYLEANYPIVVSGELLRDGVVNQARVDNSSYLYEFLTEILSDSNRSNIFVSDELETERETFAFYANRPKLTLYSPTYPNLIMTTKTYLADGESSSNVTEILPINERYYLQYDFIIVNDSAAVFSDDYTCKLYLDSNADGKFSKGYEELSLNASNIVEVATGKTVGSTSALKTGVRYQVSREIPESFHGCITWQLEVSQTGCPGIRTQHKGYTKLAGDEAATIKILQVYYALDDKVINLEHSIGHFDSGKKKYDNTAIAETGYATNHFQKLAQNVSDDYILDIKTIHKTVFDTGYFDAEKNEPIILDDYDMLILGFSDGVNGANSGIAWDVDWNVGVDTDLPCVDSNGAVYKNNNISHFIESGKSVLFAHDMTSTINVSDYNMTIGSALNGTKPEDYRVEANAGYYQLDEAKRKEVWISKPALARQFYHTSGTFNEYAWGYHINSKLRELVGMDTYGVTSSGVLKNGIGLVQSMAANEYVINSTAAGGNSVALVAPKKSESGRYEYGHKEVAYKPGSFREETIAEVQGFSAFTLTQRSYADPENVSYYRAGLGVNTSNTYSNKAEKINDGQITNYPYVISQMPTLAYTHQQYYTLDLNADSDMDGETDIVVWYNLAEGYYRSDDKVAEYDLTAGDVKNNYYIYSKGNVMYTGMGHWASKDQKGAVTEEEAKLFINTMIAAYNAGTRNIEIVTTTESGKETDVVYNYFDSLIGVQGNVADYTVSSDDDTVPVYYHIDDLNITQGQKAVEVHYYMEISAALAASEAFNGFAIKSTDLPDSIGDMPENIYVVDVTDYLVNQTVKVSGGEVVKARSGDGIALAVGENYRVEIPLKYFAYDTYGYSSNFYIGARTVMTNKSIIDAKEVVTYTPYTYSKMRCVNVELFDLD